MQMQYPLWNISIIYRDAPLVKVSESPFIAYETIQY
jgi:hypothetical protein